MLVSQLIERLSGMPPNMPVVIDAYEDGYDDVTTIERVLIEEHFDPGGGGYFGIYQDHEGVKTPTEVVYLA